MLLSNEPIEWLASGGHISEAQRSAARQLQARYNADPAQGLADVGSIGPGMSDILVRVVLNKDGLREAETALGWPTRAGKLVLKMALDRLAAHFASGIEAATAGETHSGSTEGESAGPKDDAQPNS